MMGIFGSMGADPTPADCDPATEEWDPAQFTCVTKGQTVNANVVTPVSPSTDDSNTPDTFCSPGQYWDIYQQACLPAYQAPSSGKQPSTPSSGGVMPAATAASGGLSNLKVPLILGAVALGVVVLVSMSSKKKYTSNRRRSRRPGSVRCNICGSRTHSASSHYYPMPRR